MIHHFPAAEPEPFPTVDVMELLRRHVPLTLLCDLVPVTGPHSREILTAEAVQDDIAQSHPGEHGDDASRTRSSTG